MIFTFSSPSRCAIFGAFFLYSSLSWAKEQTSELETIVVSASLNGVSLQNAPVSVGVIDQTTLLESMPQHPHEVFSSIPGVWVSQGSGQEHLTAIRSPVFVGAGACGQFVIAEDGIPVRANGFCNINQLFDTHYEAADRVEVVRGPHGTRFGGNALFGSINVISPSASNSNTLSFQSSTSDHKRLQWQSAGESLYHYGTVVDDSGWRQDESLKQQKWALRWLPRTDSNGAFKGLSVHLNNLEQETAGFIFGEESYRTQQRKENAFPEAYRDASSVRAQAKFSWGSGDRNIQLTPYIRHHDMRFLMHFVPWQPVETNRHQSAGLLASVHEAPNSTLSIRYGVMAEFTQGELQEIQHAPAPFAQARFPEGAHYDYEVSNSQADAFIEMDYTLAENWLLQGFYRVGSTDYDYTNHLEAGFACEEGVSGCRFYRPESRKDTFVSPSYRVASVYKFSAESSLYVSAGSAYRAPQATELYRLQSSLENNIDAVRVDAFDIGVRGRYRVLDYDVSYFYMLQKDGIDLDSERRFINGVESEHAGLEYQFNIDVYGGVYTSLVGTYAEHRYTNNPQLLGLSETIKNNFVDTAPKALARLDTGIRRGGWHIKVSAKHHDAYYLDALNQHEYSGHTLWDTLIEYQVNEGASLSFKLNNVFDRRFANRADFAFGEYRYFPGQDRHAVFGLKLSF